MPTKTANRFLLLGLVVNHTQILYDVSLGVTNKGLGCFLFLLKDFVMFHVLKESVLRCS